MLLTSTVSVDHCSPFFIIIDCHVADGNVAPASHVNKGRRRVSWLTCIHVDSDDDLRHHCQDDVARPLTCQVVLLPSDRRAFTLTCQVVVIHPLSWRRGVATWSLLGCAADVGGGQTVVGGGYGGDAAGWWMVVVVKKKKSLFVHNVHVSFRQTPLTQHSIKRGWSLT